MEDRPPLKVKVAYKRKVKQRYLSRFSRNTSLKEMIITLIAITKEKIKEIIERNLTVRIPNPQILRS